MERVRDDKTEARERRNCGSAVLDWLGRDNVIHGFTWAQLTAPRPSGRIRAARKAIAWYLFMTRNISREGVAAILGRNCHTTASHLIDAAHDKLRQHGPDGPAHARKTCHTWGGENYPLHPAVYFKMCLMDLYMADPDKHRSRRRIPYEYQYLFKVQNRL